VRLYYLTVRESLRCRCRTVWCVLDAVLLCKSKHICDAHDAGIWSRAGEPPEVAA
jgi:hypothetical protein